MMEIHHQLVVVMLRPTPVLLLIAVYLVLFLFLLLFSFKISNKQLVTTNDTASAVAVSNNNNGTATAGSVINNHSGNDAASTVIAAAKNNNATATSGSVMISRSGGEPPPLARSKGVENYSAEELDDLLSTVAFCNPLDSDDSLLVARWHLKKHSTNKWEGKKLERKFYEMANKKPSTGNPELRKAEKKAKKIKEQIHASCSISGDFDIDDDFERDINLTGSKGNEAQRPPPPPLMNVMRLRKPPTLLLLILLLPMMLELLQLMVMQLRNNLYLPRRKRQIRKIWSDMQMQAEDIKLTCQ
jgi:hypothetical protein